MTTSSWRARARRALVLPLAVGLLAEPAGAQDRLKAYPGYEQYARIRAGQPGRYALLMEGA